ncbi:alpha/beta hydrolase [Cellulosilyticum ruminicola]
MKEISDAYMKNIKIEEYCPASHAEAKKNVAYGTMSHQNYYSNTTHSERGYNVLLPANYNPSKKYPVLYILHGIFGDEFSMTEGANAIKEIVGNQISEGTAKEMIVVFPNMYACTNGQPPSFSDAGVAGYDNFINDLVNDLMPHIESKYSVLTGRENTAIAGFSMGGREILYIGITRPDLFGYVMAIAPAPGVTPSRDSNMIHKGQLSENELRIANQNAMPYALMICCGTSDEVVGGFPESYHKILERNNTNHIWYTVGGADHNSIAIRSGINNFVGAIFHADKYTK